MTAFVANHIRPRHNIERCIFILETDRLRRHLPDRVEGRLCGSVKRGGLGMCKKVRFRTDPECPLGAGRGLCTGTNGTYGSVQVCADPSAQ